MEYNVVVNTDDNYIQHCMAMLCSLYENNKKHDIFVHVLKKELNKENEKLLQHLSNRYNNQIAFYTVDELKLQGVQFRKNRPLSMAAYYRLLLSTTLPSTINKVLYLDCDMIILRDISEIFQIELDDYALAATLDHFPYSAQHRLQLHMECGERTFCSGIMMINLKYWRDNHVEEGLLEYAKRNRKIVYLHDQDVLNYYFKKKWFLLPPKWNRVALSLPTQNDLYKHFDLKEALVSPMLIHYADPYFKPWYNISYPDRDHYLKYLRLSEFPYPIFNQINNNKRVFLWQIKIKYPIKKFLLSYKLRKVKI